MESNKAVALLKSRKFWASVVSLLVSLGVVAWGESQQAEMVSSLTVVAGALAPVILGGIYVLATAFEDAAKAKAATPAARPAGEPEANQNG